jgi:anti-sigma factor RsiW
MPEDSVTELDLLAYADGRLDPPRQREVERVVARRPDLKRIVEATRRQNEAIRDTYEAVLDRPVPHRLTAILERPERRRNLSQIRQTAAVLGLVCLAGAAGWSGRTLVVPGEEGDVISYVDAVRHGPQSSSGLNGQRSLHWPVTANTEPLEWLADRVTLELRAPDLRQEGYEPESTSLVEIDGRPSVQLRFKGTNGDSVDLYLRTRWQEGIPSLHVDQEADDPVIYWFDGPLMWVMTGDDVSAPQLKEVAVAIHNATRLRPGTAPQPPVQNALDMDAGISTPQAQTDAPTERLQ